MGNGVLELMLFVLSSSSRSLSFEVGVVSNGFPQGGESGEGQFVQIFGKMFHS